MARIAGVNIPTQKRVEIALQYIHGIGKAHAKEICGKAGITPERRVSELTDAEVLQLRETIDKGVRYIYTHLPRLLSSSAKAYLKNARA